MAAPTISEPRPDGGSGEDSGSRYLVVMPQNTTHRLPASGSVIIGRGDDAQVRIVGNSRVSRFHACLHVGPGIELEDMGTPNGTCLRERAIAPGQRVPLAIGEAFTIGDDTVLIVRMREP